MTDAKRQAFGQDVDTALDMMSEWYDGYRFGKRYELPTFPCLM